MTEHTIGEQLQALRARSGLSLREVADGAGYSGPSSVQVFFAPHYDPPALDNIVARRLATALSGHGSEPIREEEVLALSAFSPMDRQIAAAPKPIGPNDTKIGIVKTFGIARRGWRVEGRLVTLEAFTVQVSEVVAFAPCPPGIRNPKDAYVIHMTGDALAPRYYSGEPVYFETWRTPGRGDFVVLVLIEAAADDHEPINSPANAIIGQLVRRSEKGFFLRQFTPPRSAWIPDDAVAAVFRVMKWAEVCGTLTLDT